jgi:hypothetical protein
MACSPRSRETTEQRFGQGHPTTDFRASPSLAASSAVSSTTNRPPPSSGTRITMPRPSLVTSSGPSPVRGFIAAILPSPSSGLHRPSCADTALYSTAYAITPARAVEPGQPQPFLSVALLSRVRKQNGNDRPSWPGGMLAQRPYCRAVPGWPGRVARAGGGPVAGAALRPRRRRGGTGLAPPGSAGRRRARRSRGNPGRRRACWRSTAGRRLPDRPRRTRPRLSRPRTGPG